MEPMIVIPVLLIIAISVQCVLSIKQGKSLSNTFYEMKEQGNVLVGKYKNYFRGGAYIFFNIDNQGIVEDAKVIYGRTIFSSMKCLSECIGNDICALSFEKRCVQKAYEDAVGYYREALNSFDESDVEQI